MQRLLRRFFVNILPTYLLCLLSRIKMFVDARWEMCPLSMEELYS